MMKVELVKEIFCHLKLSHVHSSQLNWDLVLIYYTRISALKACFPLHICMMT